MADEKKRVSLPVLREAPDEEEERPASAWVLLGAVAIVVILIPLGGVAWTIGRKFQGETALPVVVAAVVAIALSSFFGGRLAGRFGRGVLPRHGAAAGAVAG